ncbi:MAG: class II fructose-bisphosphate aldolase [Euryarchaeota archaeon]|nr:class II fructose-bisphosphate aldolase [Euryarchaeota archaeon]
MPFLSGEELDKVYKEAKRNQYAFPANNFADFNLLQGFLDGAEAVNADCVVQLSNGACKFLGRDDMKRGLRIGSNMVQELAESYSIGVALNLDHTRKDKTDFLRYAADQGLATSVMIDASDLPFEDNLAATKEVTKFAHDAGLLVEAELGKVLGEEDHIVAEDTGDDVYTDPRQAVEFIRQTDADLLAVCIGTNHGVSKGKDMPLRVDVMTACNEAMKKAGLECYFVLHGGSGVDPERIQLCIQQGVVKINKDTEYQFVWTQAMVGHYDEIRDSAIHPDGGPSPLAGRGDWSPDKKRFDPRPALKHGRGVIAKRTQDMIREGGSDGKSLFAKKVTA